MLMCVLVLMLVLPSQLINGIGKLPTVFNKLKALDGKSLHNNFVCDCSLLSLSKWLNVIHRTEEILCSEPMNLRGIPVSRLSEFLGSFYLLQSNVEGNCDDSDKLDFRERVRRATNIEHSGDGIVASYSPSKPTPDCPLTYELNTNMSLTMNYTSQLPVEYRLHLNNVVVKTTTISTLWYVFDTVGDFNLTITANSSLETLSWKQQVVVKMNSFNIELTPKLRFANVSTTTNITFFLQKKAGRECVTTNALYAWSIDGETFAEENVTHVFRSVGRISKNIIVKVNNFPIDSKHVQLYDKISNFTVNISLAYCSNESINVALETGSGTAVSYHYQLLPTAVEPLSSGGILPINQTIGDHIITFWARNAVSELNIQRRISILQTGIKVILSPWKVPTNVQVNIKPMFFKICRSYYYKWHIGSVMTTAWRLGSSNFVPDVMYNFTNEDKYNTTLEVQYNDNSSYIIDSDFIYAEDSILFDLPTHENAHIGLYLLKPLSVITARSFQYRWSFEGLPPDDWSAGNIANQPVFQITFLEEGLYRVTLEVNNTFSSKKKTTEIFVQYSVSGVQIPETIYVETSKTYKVEIKYANKSKYQYVMNVTDGNMVNNIINTSANVQSFYYVHNYSTSGIYTLLFSFTDNLQTVYANVTVVVLSRITRVNATLLHSIVNSCQSVTGRVHDMIDSEILSTQFHWYRSSPQGLIFINTGLEMYNTTFPVPGNYSVSVRAENEISNFTFNMSLLVTDESHLDTAFVATALNMSFIKQNVKVPPNTLVQFNVTTPKNLPVVYQWFFDKNLESKVKTNLFSHNFTQQGDYSILVNVSANCSSSISETRVYVQKKLTKVELIVLADDKTILNNSVAGIATSKLYINHVYYEPTDAEGVRGDIHCHTDEVGLPKKTLLFGVYSPEWSNMFEVPIVDKQVEGRISCLVVLDNLLSIVEAQYNYFVGSAPILEFSNPLDYVEANQTVEFRVHLLNHNLAGQLQWFLNSSEVVSCSNSDECVLFFQSIGFYAVDLVLKNEYFEVHQSHNITVLNRLHSGSISPLHTLQGKSVNVTVSVQGTSLGVIQYSWNEQNSISNYIIFGKHEHPGVYNITVNVSNAISSLLVTEYFVVYQNLTDDVVFIQKNSDYVKKNTKATFVSSVTDSYIQYKWLVNGDQVSNENSLQCWFNATGMFNITLGISTPYESKSTYLNISVIDPVTNVVISPLYIPVQTSTRVSVSANGGGKLSYFWHEYNITEKYILLNPNLPSKKNISVLISNPVSEVTTIKTLHIYDVRGFAINSAIPYVNQDNNRFFYVSHNTTVEFSVSHPDPNSQYSWEVKYDNRIIVTGETGKLYTHKFGTDSGKYQIYLHAQVNPSIKSTKDAFVYVNDYSINIHQNLSDKFLFTNETYGITISWNKYPIATDAILNTSGIETSSYSYTKNLSLGYFSLSFRTPTDKRSIYVSMKICKRFFCNTRTWIFVSQPKIKEVKLDRVINHVFLNDTLTLTIKEVIPKVVIIWSLIDFATNKTMFLGNGKKLDFFIQSNFSTGQYAIEVKLKSPFIDTADQTIIQRYDLVIYSDKCEELDIKLFSIPFSNVSKMHTFPSTSYKYSITWKKYCFTDNQSIIVSNAKNVSFMSDPLSGHGVVSFTTLEYVENITLSIALCKHGQCIHKLWTLISLREINTKAITFKERDRYVEINDTFRASIDNDLPGALIIWELLEKGTNNSRLLGNASSIDVHLPRYLSPGEYTVRVTVISKFIDNANHRLIKTFVINIFFEDCKKPYVDLGGSEEREHTMSKWFRSEINVNTACPNITYHWSFSIAPGKKCPQNPERKIYNVNTLPGFKLTTDTRSLEVPPRGFSHGNYCIQNIISYGKTGILFVSFHLTVLSTPLVPVISGGSYRVIGNKQDIFLEATKTIDPDILMNEKSDLLYKWEVENEYCFFNSKESNISIYSAVNANISIKQECLKPERGKFKLHVMRHVMPNFSEEPAFAIQKVDVIEGVAPVIQIECVTCNVYKSFKYIASKKIKMFTICLNCGKVEGEYKWEIIDAERRPIELTSENVLSPLGTSVLVLDKNVLDGVQDYTFISTVIVDGMDAKGTTQIELEKNLSPENGTCNMSPLVGFSMVDNFTISCQDWFDDDNMDPITNTLNQPFIYSLLAGSSSDPSEMSIIYRGIKGNFKTQLPPGNESNSGELFIQILVEDSFGAQTVAFNKSISVTKPTAVKEDPVQFVVDAVMPLLAEQVKSKDVSLVTLAVVACSDFLSQPTKHENRSAALDTLVTSAAKMDASSVESISQILDALTRVVKIGGQEDIGSDARGVASDSLKRLLDMSGSFSLEGRDLEDNAYNGFMELLNSNIEYYDRVSASNRSSSHTGANSTELGVDYVNMQQLYGVILNVTIAGESDRELSSNSISTLLSRNNGKQISGSLSTGACKVTTNMKKISNLADVSGVFECSRFDPYHELSSVFINGSISSLRFLSSDSSEIPISNLPKDENIKFSIPHSFSSLHENSTITLNEDEIHVSVLPSRETFQDLDSVGINIVVDITTADFYGNVHVHFSKNVNLTFENKQTRKLSVNSKTEESLRTIFLSGSEYQPGSTYFYGIEHDSVATVNLTITVYISYCRFWNTTINARWDKGGCKPGANTTRQLVVCLCNHLTAFTSLIDLAPNPLDFTVLKKLDISSNPVALATCLVIVVIYMIILFIAYRKDKNEQTIEHFIPYVGSDEGFYQYEIRLKTGLYPWAGTTASVGIQIFGTSCTTKVRVIKTDNSFQRNAVDIFRISVDRSIGKIHKILIWHDNSGANPSWYLERVVIRSLVNGEKFFFFCNRWIGTDCEDGCLEHEFLVADKHEMQKFSTIFFDVIGRGFNDYHLWLSVFERPKFSKFTRVQRVTCLVTFVLSWMCVNAMWFNIAPDGKVDVYIGFKGYSFEEILIGMISVVIVFPLNFVLIALFRKSRQAHVPSKPLKIYKPTKHLKMQMVDIDTLPLCEDQVDSSDAFDISLLSSPLRRKKRCFNVHDFLMIENTNADQDGLRSDNLVLRTSMAHGAPTHSTSLTLPHAFEDYLERTGDTYIPNTPTNVDSIPLTVSPRHQYRTSSARLPRRNVGYVPLELSLKRTQSSDSLQLLPSTNEAARLMTPRLNPDELRSHMTDIVEHQLSSLFQDLQDGSEKSQKHDFGLPSDYSSGIYHQEAITSALVKKNEMLAERLEIPEICELDPCTRWTLPHWCTYIGYFLCFIVSGMSIVIVITYGQQFGYDVSLKWLRALFVGFLEDCLIAYPFVLIITASIVALFIKPLDLDKVDHYDFVECPSGAMEMKNATETAPPSGFALELAQREGIRRKRVRMFVKDFILQSFLVWFVVAICTIKYSNRMYPCTYQLEKRLNQPIAFENISSIGEYWSWMETTWLPSLYEVDEKPIDSWQLASRPFIRQVRAATGDCISEEYAAILNMTSCSRSIYTSGESYVFNWSTELNETSHVDSHYSPWTFLYDGKSSRKFGIVADYPPAGYEVLLPHPNETDAVYAANISLLPLKSRRWIDADTRALIHDYVMLNNDTLQYSFVELLVEITSTGFIVTSINMRYLPLYYFYSNIDYFCISCVLFLALLVVYMFCHTVGKVHRNGFKEMMTFWDVHMMLTILFSAVGITMQIAELFLLHDFRAQMINGFVPDGMSVHNMAFYHDVGMYVFGFLGFLVMFRNVRLFSLWNFYQYCADVLKNSFVPLANFSLMYVLFVLGFSGCMLLEYQPYIYEYRSFWNSFLSTLFSRWCKSGARKMVDTSYWMGLFWSILWMLFWLIFVVNVYRAIILNTDAKRNTTPLDVWSFIWKKIRRSRKKHRRVRFINVQDDEPGEEDIIETAFVNTPPLPPHEDLPPLPVPLFDLESNFLSVLAGLDQMVVHEEWEIHVLSQLEQHLRIAKSKPLYKIEKLPK